jgi:hypothetical protein
MYTKPLNTRRSRCKQGCARGQFARGVACNLRALSALTALAAGSERYVLPPQPEYIKMFPAREYGY